MIYFCSSDHPVVLVVRGYWECSRECRGISPNVGHDKHSLFCHHFGKRGQSSNPPGSLDEIVEDGKHGVLIAVEDVDKHHRMGKAAKQRLPEFYSIDHMREKYLSLMIDILDNRVQFRK